MSRPTAAQSPVSGIAPFLAMLAAAVLAVAAPMASAALWSDSGWRPRGMRRLAAAYAHLFAPEEIAGSGMSGPAFGVTVVAMATTVVAVSSVVMVRVGASRQGRRRGLATRADLAAFSARATVERSRVILGERDVRPETAGFCVGREQWTGQPVWLSKELTVLVLAPPRAGKTTCVVAPAVVDHHGPVVATGVRADIMALTHRWRRHRGGPMWLCEPMRESGPLPAGVSEVRWSPLAGCDSLLGARLRAEALFSALPKAGSEDQFWRTAGTTLLATYLLAAARNGGTVVDVLDWIDHDNDQSPVDVLERSADELDDPYEREAVMSASRQLGAAIAQDPRYKAGVTGQAVQAVEPFRLPAVQRMCVLPIEESFDPDEFLEQAGTIWMLGSVSYQSQAAGVCTALTASIVEAARSRALRESDGRLKPPLLLALDEAVNVAPIPRLDQLLSTGGGSGIQTMVVVQSMAAARNVWGKEMGDALQDFNNAKVVLGGLADAQDLKDISDQLGMRDEMVTQASRRAGAVFVPSDYSHSWRQVPVMTPAEVRMIDSARSQQALLIARDTRGIMLQLTPIYERRREEESGNLLQRRGRLSTLATRRGQA